MKKVLIIDDELDICMLLKAYLQKNDFSVNYAVNLKEGMLAIKNNTPDTVILDNNLPDGLGINTIDSIKTDFPETQLIMISAMTSLQSKALKKGADFFVPKPFKLSHISQLIHQN
ncbi:response regulator [Arcticibacterium luteifluviistationis]|uniref:Response regulator n=1 Tax=Arcticibacterium luteifluviistationis TaxID=1784714 RepID=A0A2Z4GH70_9BACT|nr:response regulator [Arcticibacterium luteifluviistationis]AWW00386.1 response regulator [Arcticibacterium luteifluviistationis]